MAVVTEDRGPMFKIVLLGEAGVGKTSLFFRLKDNTFTPHMRNTIGIDNCSKHMTVDDQNLTLSIWDTAGVERFRTVTKNYYRGAHACVLMFSVDEAGTLQYLTHWVRDAEEFCPDALKFVIANKIDLESTVNSDSMELFASSHNCCKAFQISAKTGEGISQAFDQISKVLMSGDLSSSEERDRSISVGMDKTPDPTVKQWKNGCCSSV